MLPGRAALLTLLSLSLAAAANPPTWSDLAGLRNLTYVQVSPDGERIAYVLAGQVWIGYARPHATPKAIAKGSLPTWSPDSSKLAFYSSQSGSQQLWTV